MRDPNQPKTDAESNEKVDNTASSDSSDETNGGDPFHFAGYNSELEVYLDEKADEPLKSDDSDFVSTHLVPDRLEQLRQELISLDICNEKQWASACEMAANANDVEQVLLALYEIQNADPTARTHPPLTMFQLNRIREGCIDRLKVGQRNILDEIYVDRTGTIYRAWNRSLSRLESVKFLAKFSSDSEGEFESSDQRLARALKKIESLAQLNDHHITKVFDAGNHEGIPFIVTEYVEGANLQSEVEAARSAGESVPIWWAAAKVRDIASALSYARSLGVVHKELTPRNVVITPSGEAKILNIGLADLFNHSRSSTESLNHDLRAALAPERWLHPDAISPAADVYALGCLLFFIVTGRHVFEGSHDELRAAHLHQTPPLLSDLRPRVPRKLDRIVHRMLAKMPSARPTYEEVIEQLAHLSKPDNPSGWLSGSLLRSAAMLVVSMVMGSLITIVVFLTVFGLPERTPQSERNEVRLNDLAAEFYADNQDAWESKTQLRTFLARHSSNLDDVQALKQLMEAESWRRRWRNWLASHQEENPDVWPTREALNLVVNPFGPAASSEQEFDAAMRKVVALTRSKYETRWNEWLHKRWSEQQQFWPTYAALKEELGAETSVVDAPSLRSEQQRFAVLLDEKTKDPFRPDSWKDDGSAVGAMARVLRWIAGLPEPKRLENVVEMRAVFNGAPVDVVEPEQRVQIQVRTNKPGFLTVIVFQQTGRQLLLQSDLVEPGSWQDLFFAISELEGIHEMLTILTDVPTFDSPPKLQRGPANNNLKDAIHVSHELELGDVARLKERFVDQAAYERTMDAVKKAQGLPQIPPLRNVGWYSANTLKLICQSR